MVLFSLILLPLFYSLLGVGKEMKESRPTAQHSLALFLLRKFAFIESLLSWQTAKALRPRPLVLRRNFLIIIKFLHSENTISEHMAILNILRKISASPLNIYRISLYLICNFFNFPDISLWLASLHSRGRFMNLQRGRLLILFIYIFLNFICVYLI